MTKTVVSYPSIYSRAYELPFSYKFDVRCGDSPYPKNAIGKIAVIGKYYYYEIEEINKENMVIRIYKDSTKRHIITIVRMKESYESDTGFTLDKLDSSMDFCEEFELLIDGKTLSRIPDEVEFRLKSTLPKLGYKLFKFEALDFEGDPMDYYNIGMIEG